MLVLGAFVIVVFDACGVRAPGVKGTPIIVSVISAGSLWVLRGVIGLVAKV